MLLKPMLARGEVRCIGATTPDKYRRFIEKDPGLERRFQQVGWVAGWLGHVHEARGAASCITTTIRACVLRACVCACPCVATRVSTPEGNRGGGAACTGGQGPVHLAQSRLHACTASVCLSPVHPRPHAPFFLSPNRRLGLARGLGPAPAQVPLAAPTVTEAISVLRGLRKRYEVGGGLTAVRRGAQPGAWGLGFGLGSIEVRSRWPQNSAPLRPPDAPRHPRQLNHHHHHHAPNPQAQHHRLDPEPPPPDAPRHPHHRRGAGGGGGAQLQVHPGPPPARQGEEEEPRPRPRHGTVTPPAHATRVQSLGYWTLTPPGGHSLSRAQQHTLAACHPAGLAPTIAVPQCHHDVATMYRRPSTWWTRPRRASRWTWTSGLSSWTAWSAA